MSATITNVPNSINLDDINPSATLTFNNPSNRFLRLVYIVDSVTIKTVDLGQVTSALFSLDSGDVDLIYQTVTSSNVGSVIYRLRSFTDSGYTTQDGTDQDKSSSFLLIDTAFNPVFTDFDLTSEDATVEVRDKYNNLLITSQTNTLIGGTSLIIIPDFTSLKFSVTVADKAIAQEYATMSHYSASYYKQVVEEYVSNVSSPQFAYSDVATVSVVVNNVTLPSADAVMQVRAVDSRGRLTGASKTATLFLDYTPIEIYTAVTERDNLSDPATKLIITGKVWNKYFSTGTTSGGAPAELNGVQGFQYRYKPRADAWGAQTWNNITASVDGSGNISFDDYISGDLGADGFDSENVYDIEVRVWDRVTHDLVDVEVSKGVVAMEWYNDGTDRGISVGKRYDTTEGGSLQVIDDIQSEEMRSGWKHNAHEASYVGISSNLVTLSLTGQNLHEYKPAGQVIIEQPTDASLIYNFVDNSDELGNYDLTEIGDPVYSTDSVFNNAVELDGSDGFTIDDTEANGGSGAILAFGDYTVSSWFKSSASAVQGIFQIFSWRVNRAGLRLQMNADGTLRLVHGSATGVTQGTHWQQVDTVNSFNDGVWHMVTATFDGASLSIYVDGLLEATASYANNAGYETPALGFTYTRIGCNKDDTGAETEFFTGSLTNIFYIDGTALLAKEIADIYHKGSVFDNTNTKIGKIVYSTRISKTTQSIKAFFDGYNVLNDTINYIRYKTPDIGRSFPTESPTINWVPAVTYSGGTTNPTSTTINFANYRIEGRLLYFEIRYTIVKGSGNRNFVIFSLPVTRPNNNHIRFASYANYGSATEHFGGGYSDTLTTVLYDLTIAKDGAGFITGMIPL